MRRKLLGVLAALAAGLILSAGARAQTISNYNSRMTSCLQNVAYQQAIVPFHTVAHPEWWWVNAGEQIQFDVHPGGGGNVRFLPPSHQVIPAAWTYYTNANGTVLKGSQGYVYGNNLPSFYVNFLANCVYSSSDH